MPKHITIINLACTITKLRKWGQAWKHSAESAQNAASQLTAEHERKLAEHRAAFGARTEADAKIIEGLRSELQEARRNACLPGESLNDAITRTDRELDTAREQRDSLQVERDVLRAEVADLRGIFDMVHASLGIKRGDHIGNAIAQLKAQTPKRSHPVAVGEYLRRLTGFSTTPAGEVAQVLHVDCDAPTTEHTVKRPNGQQGVWSESGCEPCDPPADHDTTAGKEAAASVIRNSQMTEIKVGDVVEVVSASGGQTWMADVGSTGKVRCFELIDNIECVQLQNLPGKRNALGGYVSLCDVRKVPQ